jgi:hypothetical protein
VIPQTCASGSARLASTPLRRLAHAEYENTVRDLLGEAPPAAVQRFPADPRVAGYDNSVNIAPTEPLLEAYMEGAESLAAAAVAKLSGLLPCNPQTAGEETCAGQFIRDFGRRAYRHPPDAEETAVLMNVFRTGRGLAGADFASAIRLVVTAILQAPQFLYRFEIGTGVAQNGVKSLSDYEVASRLSYALWSTMPDEELFAAAAAGALRTPEQVTAQATRMLAHTKASQGLARFSSQWMPVAELATTTKDPQRFAAWTPTVAAALKQEVIALVEDVVRNGDRKFATLLTAPYSMLNGTLADYYGMPGAATGGSFRKVALDPARYAGVMTRAGFLGSSSMSTADLAHPVRRGVFVRTQFLCQHLPPPPPEVAAELPEPQPNETLRQGLDRVTSTGACAGCHKMINPVGFGFEHFDADGRWRAEDAGKPIDATGELFGQDSFATDADGPYNGANELAAKLAGSETARACFARQYFTFTQGRVPESGDGCLLADVHGRAKAADYDVREMMLALASSPALLQLATGDAP